MARRFFVVLLPFTSFLMGFVVLEGLEGRTDDRGRTSLYTDTDKNYTSVGNIGMTVTNFGTIGTRNAYWPNQPSCEFPRGSRIEHLYQGGLWVGGVSRRTGQIHVSTGSSDQVSITTGKGLEFTSDPGTDLIQRSTLPESQYFSESAISHQDFVGFYNDQVPRDSSAPDQSVPLGIEVRQETYAWNYPFADFFVIVNYTIRNASVTADTLDSLYVGLWTNTVVRNTNNVRPGTPGYFTHGANGYSDSLRMQYTFDFDGIPAPPPANSYIGVKLLGSTPFPHGVDSVGNMNRHTYYNAWKYQSSSGDAAYFSPSDDAGTINGARSRYDRLSASLPQSSIDPLRTRPDNMTTLLSAGPFGPLAPGDSVNVAFGIICARKFGTAPASLDTREQRKTLYANALLCEQAYEGEDSNGNDQLDPGEDVNGNNKLDHYLLPQPPRPPKVHVDVQSQSVTIYWDKSTSEQSIDPITKKMDFEGYRVYRSNAGADFTNPEDYLLNLTLAADFDRADDNIGYNTGFSRILLPQAKYFPGDTVAYWYRFPPPGSDVSNLNGWQYVYGVSAYDQGDTSLGISSLESKTELRRAIPGATPARVGTRPVGVYPNPYYASAIWDGQGERNRKIYFTNLPAKCDIRVYTLAGDVVADIHHDAATYDGSDINWFQRFGDLQTPPQFSGGEHAWDLITKFDQAIATGLYLFSVKDLETGDIAVGKFLVIK